MNNFANVLFMRCRKVVINCTARYKHRTCHQPFQKCGALCTALNVTIVPEGLKNIIRRNQALFKPLENVYPAEETKKWSQQTVLSERTGCKNLTKRPKASPPILLVALSQPISSLHFFRMRLHSRARVVLSLVQSLYKNRA